MTTNTADENGYTNDSSNEGVISRERMMGEATKLAELLAGRGNVARVGVAGSLARGKENPSDIDLVIFTGNETAKACHREKMALLREKSGKKVSLSRYLSMSDEAWNYFVTAYAGIDSSIDIQIVSNEPDEDYIRMMARDNIDPNYLTNISKDMLLYDPPTGVFRKETVFGETQERVMEEAGFDRIKEIMSEPNGRFYDTIMASHSHKKRSDKATGGKQGLEEIRTIFEIESKEKAELDRVSKYKAMVETFNRDPFSSVIWDEVINLARAELRAYDGSEEYYLEDLGVTNIYDQIPLNELINIGTRLRTATSGDERYQILMERNSYGELWYDIILGHVNDKMFQPIVDKIQSSGNRYQKGLDIGCGSGNSLRMMAPICEECIGLDELNTPLMEVRKNGLPENVRLVDGDGTKLPFTEETFDVATSNGLTHYLSKPEIREYVREIDRVLKPGGSYYEAVATIKKDHVLPGFEGDYLLSAKSVLVCLLDRMCTNVDNTEVARNPTTVLINSFNELGYQVRFSGFDDSDLGVLTFYK